MSSYPEAILTFTPLVGGERINFRRLYEKRKTSIIVWHTQEFTVTCVRTR